MRKIFFFLLIIFISSCGGISVISRGKEDFYTKNFMTKINSIKKTYEQGQTPLGLKQLELIKDQGLTPEELAMKRNLLGIIYFSKNNYEKAIFQFNRALTTSKLDNKLTSQIYLNLASAYYKLEGLENTFTTLLLCRFEYLTEKESLYYFTFKYSVAKSLGRKEEAIKALIWPLIKYETINPIKSSIHYNELLTLYFSLKLNNRMKILEEFLDHGKYLIIGYLGHLEIEKMYANSEKKQSLELAEYLSVQYSGSSFLNELFSSFKLRLENYALMNQFSIGVILPLTGKKANFGRRALAGIEHGLRQYNEAQGGSNTPLSLFVKDNMGSPIVAKRRVKELVEGKNISLIIGGLFTSEASKEYEEARKYDVFYISMSQVLNKMKNNLLLEIPGSIESQISFLFSDEFLNKFGMNGAIIYPNTEKGENYVNLFWHTAKLKNIKISNIHRYDKKKTDHRDTVRKLLGLKFTRERLEELNILKNLHLLEGPTSIRRIQTLKPEINFDWVFIPSSPNDALQILPSFSYFDAFNISIIGDQRWRSKTISRESYKLGQLYFIDGSIPTIDSELGASFNNHYHKRLRLIELLGYDAIKVAHNVLTNATYQNRKELSLKLENIQHISGITGTWTYSNGIWLKKMLTLGLYKGKAAIVNMKVIDE